MEQEERRDKTLEVLIKEAELQKIKSETREVNKRLKQARLMGVPIVQIIFGGIVVGFIFLNYLLPIITLDTDLERKKTELIAKEEELNKIQYSLERSKLETANYKLKLKQAKLDSLNIALNNKAKLLQIDANNTRKELARLNLEQRNLINEIKSLEREKRIYRCI